MSNSAITLHDLSKQFHVGAKQEPYSTFRDTLAWAASAPIRAFRRRERKERNARNTFWALKDLNLSIPDGEVVGIIGRNGAGKSTLLKILSRITEPTSGYAEIRGRVGSLLEVGTGFHYELSGRENIYLNGAILGMRRGEIERKFDEIVAFSGVEKFIDTAVKHYSSGMYLRLAFAVAAHFEPEILLVDEVLAVGDAEFQKRCLGKMGDIASQGRTVLLVSHNLAAIKELCRTGLVLREGSLQYYGPVVDALSSYSTSMADAQDEGASSSGWTLLTLNGQPCHNHVTLDNSEPLSLRARLDLPVGCTHGHLYCMIHDFIGEQVVHQKVRIQDLADGRLSTGSHNIHVEFPTMWLSPGVYTIHLKLIAQDENGSDIRYFSERSLIDIHGHFDGTGRSSIAPPVKWGLLDKEEAQICSVSSR